MILKLYLIRKSELWILNKFVPILNKIWESSRMISIELYAFIIGTASLHSLMSYCSTSFFKWKIVIDPDVFNKVEKLYRRPSFYFANCMFIDSDKKLNDYVVLGISDIILHLPGVNINMVNFCNWNITRDLIKDTAFYCSPT